MKTNVDIDEADISKKDERNLNESDTCNPNKPCKLKSSRYQMKRRRKSCHSGRFKISN